MEFSCMGRDAILEEIANGRELMFYKDKAEDGSIIWVIALGPVRDGLTNILAYNTKTEAKRAYDELNSEAITLGKISTIKVQAILEIKVAGEFCYPACPYYNGDWSFCDLFKAYPQRVSEKYIRENGVVRYYRVKECFESVV